MNRSDSFRRRFLRTYLAVACAPLLLLAVATAWIGSVSLKTAAEQMQSEVAARVSSNVAQHLAEAVARVSTLDQYFDLQQTNSETTQDILSRTLTQSDSFQSLAIVDGGGDVLLFFDKASLTPPEDFAGSDLIRLLDKTTRSKAPTFGAFPQIDASGRPRIVLSYPLVDLKTGDVDKTLVAILQGEALWRILRETQLTADRDVYVMNGDGAVIAHRDPVIVQQGRRLEDPLNFGLRSGLHGDLVIMAGRKVRVEGVSYLIVAEEKLFAALSPAFRLITVIFALLCCGVFVAIRLSRKTNKQIVEPIDKISEVARAVGSGDLSARTELCGHDEISRLGQVFDDMTVKVQQLMMTTEEQKQILEVKNAEIQQKALHDALTGLPNRRYIDQHLSLVEIAAKEEQQDFAIIHMDLDRFKEINDTIGHDAGDYILKHAATVLNDVIDVNDRAFRIGGDEFVIVTSPAPSISASKRLAERITAAIRAPIPFHGHMLRVGASAGVAFGVDADKNAWATLVNADLALYRAKKEGRNRVELFTQDLQRQISENKQLADQLIVALERQEFFPVFQPQFYADTLELRGLEVLCRWNHPERGVLAPGFFWETASDMHMIGQIDKIIFAKAAEALKRLRAGGVVIPKVSFNVTADRLMLPDLADTLRASIDQDTKIALELLESMSLDTLSDPLQMSLDALREKHIEIEIDDFGSCRASIAGLMSVSPQAMKIDRQIVTPITHSERHLRLVEAIIEIGKTLSIEVVAEGVETDEHIEILKRFGCSTLQGYGLGRPMPEEDLAVFLGKRREVVALAAI
ncbi:MAG: EAL domain-containing protein [Rhodobacteraceae bacterium]|nr:EAL domain-containing protein [Paracoccaceae bacterium]